MITCQELDSLVTELCDLTREMSGLERIREATQLQQRAEDVPRQFLMQWRAAAVADLHYLEGMSLRGIAAQLGNSFQGVSQWLSSYGPTHYLLVRKIGSAAAELKVVQIEGQQTRDKLRAYTAAGFRVAPTTLNLLDGDTPRPHVRAEKLWNDLSDAARAA